MEYPKIETLYERDEKFRVMDKLRLPEFAAVGRWLVTEKVDGTNVRVFLDSDGTVRFGGRTARAQMPTFLLDYLQRTFTADRFDKAFDLGVTAILFGEGYGPKIQKGGNYRGDVAFRLFDVLIRGERDWWLNWDNVEDIAEKLGISTVPVLARDVGLEVALGCLRKGSQVALREGGNEVMQEGIVARTDPLLFMRNGHRLMWKLKDKDFAKGATE